jgi:signal-transduction protein with cAMP-binding, CBS, and nucleotidyltransferase domain
MSGDITTIDESSNAFEAARLMTAKGLGYLLVKSNGRYIGILTERDMVKKIIARKMDASKIRVKEVMSSPLICVEPKAELRDAVRMMRINGINRLLVCEGDDIRGVVSTMDITKYVL